MTIAPTACVAPTARIGNNVTIGHYAVVGENVHVEDGVHIHAHAIVDGYTTVGKNTVIYPFSCLGGTPQDTSYAGENTQLVIGENCHIREHVVIHRGTIKDKKVTTIGKDCYIMCHAHIGHDCRIGDNGVIGPHSAIGGHCHIANDVNISGHVALHHKVCVGQYAMIGGGAIVLRDVIPFALIDKGGHFSGINKVGLHRQGADMDTIKQLLKLAREFKDSPTPIVELAQTYIQSQNPYIALVGAFLENPSERGILRR